MICHVPPARIHVCVIRNRSILTSGSSPLAHVATNSIVVDRNIAGSLNREMLDRVRVEFDTFGRVRSDPVGDVIFAHRR